MHGIPRSAAILLLLPLAVGLGPVENSLAQSQQQVAGWPLSRVESVSPSVFRETTKALYIEAASGVPLSTLVRLTAFGAFKPGLTIDEAGARFGAPARTASKQGKKTAVYEFAAARIEVADELSGSGCASYHRRTLYAYPKSSGKCGALSELFDDSVVGRIPEKGVVEVGIAEAGNGQRVWTLVRDGCAEALNWWAPSSQP